MVDKRKTESITFRTSEEMRANIDDMASHEDISISAMINLLVAEGWQSRRSRVKKWIAKIKKKGE